MEFVKVVQDKKIYIYIYMKKKYTKRKNSKRNYKKSSKRNYRKSSKRRFRSRRSIRNYKGGSLRERSQSKMNKEMDINDKVINFFKDEKDILFSSCKVRSQTVNYISRVMPHTGIREGIFLPYKAKAEKNPITKKMDIKFRDVMKQSKRFSNGLPVQEGLWNIESEFFGDTEGDCSNYPIRSQIIGVNEDFLYGYQIDEIQKKKELDAFNSLKEFYSPCIYHSDEVNRVGCPILRTIKLNYEQTIEFKKLLGITTPTIPISEPDVKPVRTVSMTSPPKILNDINIKVTKIKLSNYIPKKDMVYSEFEAMGGRAPPDEPDFMGNINSCCPYDKSLNYLIEKYYQTVESEREYNVNIKDASFPNIYNNKNPHENTLEVTDFNNRSNGGADKYLGDFNNFRGDIILISKDKVNNNYYYKYWSLENNDKGRNVEEISFYSLFLSKNNYDDIRSKNGNGEVSHMTFGTIDNPKSPGSWIKSNEVYIYFIDMEHLYELKDSITFTKHGSNKLTRNMIENFSRRFRIEYLKKIMFDKKLIPIYTDNFQDITNDTFERYQWDHILNTGL